MTPAEAREIVRADPKRFRAAFVEAPGTPLLDHPQASVTLYGKVSEAYDELRARKDGLVKNGWRVTFGSLGKNLLLLERDGDVRLIGLDKARRPK